MDLNMGSECLGRQDVNPFLPNQKAGIGGSMWLVSPGTGGVMVPMIHAFFVVQLGTHQGWGLGTESPKHPKTNRLGEN